MNIKPIEVTVAELVAGYDDKGICGVVAYGGKLDVRPEYQREFVYKDAQRAAVIDTVMKGYPLNTMYWVACPDGRYEVIDGQQRTISVCQYCADEFAHDMRSWSSLTKAEQQQMLDYKLHIYVCEGNDKEKLDWFETINIAGAVLTKQELRNATYHGKWVSSARGYFSKRGCGAENMGKRYLNGAAIRQDYLETAIHWADEAENKVGIDLYMDAHRNETDARPLYEHFHTVINWVKAIFPNYRPQMKGVDWGALWALHHKREDLNADALETEVSRLMADEDIQDSGKKGIYTYVLSKDKAHDERLLNIRAFKDSDKATVYEKQKGICPRCGKRFDIKEMEADHIKPWSQGGKTVMENCQMLCKMCNRIKSDS